MVLRCIVVDDELPACDELSHLLMEMEEVEVLAGAHNGVEALAFIDALNPDAVFLDIKMPGMDGFDVARELLASQNPPLIVFATAYDEYAVDAFDVRAIDYILKPFSKARLSETIDRLKASRTAHTDLSALKEVLAHLKNDSATTHFIRIAVLEKGKIMFLSPGDVYFCKACLGKSEIFTGDRSFFCTAPLDELEERLRKENFFRVHRSYLVNLEYVRDMVPYINGKHLITMRDERAFEIPVSRRRAAALKDILVL